MSIGPTGRARLTKAHVSIEYRGEDGVNYEMAFDLTPAGDTSVTYEIDHHWTEPWDLTTQPQILHSDIEFRFDEVDYEGLVKLVEDLEVDNP